MIDSVFIVVARGLVGSLSALKRPPDSVTEVKYLVELFYELADNGAGGKLHIVLDDGNVGVDSVEFCREQARDAGDEPAFWMAQCLLMLTESEREQVYRKPT